jgi:hypothetical protein
LISAAPPAPSITISSKSREIAIATDYLRPCLSSISLIVIHAHLKSRAAANDYLTGHVGFGLQQHGIHVDARLESARFGLNGLSASYLAAAGTNRGVVRNVLRFEWRYAYSSARERSAQRGDKHALADVRRRAHYHQASGAQFSSPFRAKFV